MMLREASRAAGIPLFVRRHGRLRPTAETTVLVADLDRVLGGIERINRLVAEMTDARVGTIQVAATPTLAESLLARAVGVFQRQRPNVRIAIHTMDNLNVIASVVDEQVDLGLVLSPIGHVEARRVDLCSAALMCVAHPDSPLVAKKSVTARDLARYPLISFSRNLPLGQLVEECFRAAGLPRRIAIEVNQSSLACAMVRARAGVAIVDPFWLLGHQGHDLVHIPLHPQTLVTAHVLSPKSTLLSRPAKLLVQTLAQESQAAMPRASAAALRARAR
jgi:DNA-binding transcriptional LysR family regulator